MTVAQRSPESRFIDEASARSVSAATEDGALMVVTARAPTATNATADSLRWNICAHFLNE
jgi:hypothetical protein